MLDWKPINGLQIAIDGPSGSGKGTVVARLGEELGLPVLDTGLLYRFVGWRAAAKSLDLQDESVICAALSDILEGMQWCSDGIHLSDQKVSKELRTEEVGALASQVASMPSVREALLEVQRNMAGQGAIMDGRDIGSVVLPDAQAKFFLTASPRERARRRWSQLAASKKLDVRDKDSMAEVLADLETRDERDASRDCAPLVAAEGALVVDSTVLGIDQVIDRMLSILERRGLIQAA